MSTDPRFALEALVASLQEHLAASLSKRGDDDPALETAYHRIIEAFEAYDDALYDTTGEVTPLDLFEDDEFDEDNEGDD